MNREKHLNKAGRKKKARVNYAVPHHVDHNYAADRYKQRMPAVDVNRTEMKTRPHRPNIHGYDNGYSSTGLNSVWLNAEVFNVSECTADSCSSVLCQSRLVSNNDTAQERCEKFSNGRKKKDRICSSDFDHTNSASSVVPVSTEDGAVGFINRNSQPNVFHDELFDHEDHLLAAAPIAASVYSREKVFAFESIVFAFYHGSELFIELFIKLLLL